MFLVRASLSGGSLACIKLELNSIPRKSAVVPMMSLEWLTERPNSAHNSSNCWPYAMASASGERTAKKSSK